MAAPVAVQMRSANLAAQRGCEIIEMGGEIMKTLAKLAMGTVMAAGIAVGAAAPADAGVFIRINDRPHYRHDHFCYYHPRACERDRFYADGFYIAGRGYHHGHEWYAHRGWHRGGWRYWR